MKKATWIPILIIFILMNGCELKQSFQVKEWEDNLKQTSSRFLETWIKGVNKDLHEICGTLPKTESDELIEEFMAVETSLGKLRTYKYERISNSGTNQGIHSVHVYFDLDFEKNENLLGIVSYDVKEGNPILDFANSIDVSSREGFGSIPNYLSLRCIKYRIQQDLDVPAKYK